MNAMQHLTFDNLNCQIHYWYRKASKNKWVIFFHGAGLDHRMFEEQFNAIESTYNIIAWDARGHGMSKLDKGKKFIFQDMINDCKRLYEIYDIDKAILIGQSMGGNLAQEIAYYNPEMVDKLVVIDSSKNTAKLTVIEKYSLKCSRFIFNCYPWKLLVKQIVATCANNDSVRKYIKDCFEKQDKETFIEIMMEVEKCLHVDSDFKFKQPVQLICGSDDKYGNIKKVMKQWAANDSNCPLHIIKNAGHNSNQDNPECVNELISNFLNK